MLAPVALDLARRDDVGLADEAGAKATGLHLMAKRRSRQPELVGGFGEGQHRSVLGGGQVLRRLVGDPGRLKFGVRSPQSAGRLDAVDALWLWTRTEPKRPCGCGQEKRVVASAKYH